MKVNPTEAGRLRKEIAHDVRMTLAAEEVAGLQRASHNADRCESTYEENKGERGNLCGSRSLTPTFYPRERTSRVNVLFIRPVQPPTRALAVPHHLPRSAPRRIGRVPPRARFFLDP